jgi:hypothetical protein
MAAPHVAGSAALVKQLHPDWSPRQIKAALMGTARWRGVTVSSGQHAQPLGMLQIAHARARIPALTRARYLHSPVSNTHADMGAGVVDLTKIVDPGALLDPPSLSFGYTLKGDSQQITVTVANVAATPQNFTISSSLADSSSSVPGYNLLLRQSLSSMLCRQTLTLAGNAHTQGDVLSGVSVAQSRKRGAVRGHPQHVELASRSVFASRLRTHGLL